MKKLRLWLAAAFAATGAIPVGVANGSLILQYEPNIPLNDDYVFLNIDLTNNDEGAIYDSGELSLLTPLAQALWNNVPANQTNYTNVAELVADWEVNIQPTGDVYSGWNRTVNNDGSIDLGNLGQIGGIPDEDYTTWRDSVNFPNQNTMALTVQIPLSQLELDGIAGYDPSTDARIELGTTPVTDAFIGWTSGGAGSATDGVSYEVIPEPSSVLLSVFGLLFVCYHRLLRKSACGGRGL